MGMADGDGNAGTFGLSCQHFQLGADRRFALVVVRKGDRFLLIQESKYGEPWYLPGGRVEAGESFADAAVRETREEAGVPVRVTGVLRIEHSPTKAGSRIRVLFLAEPTDDTPPKSEPDDESLRAEWVALDELPNYALRGEPVRGGRVRFRGFLSVPCVTG